MWYLIARNGVIPLLVAEERYGSRRYRIIKTFNHRRLKIDPHLSALFDWTGTRVCQYVP
jgi:hypothetical protein